MARNLICSMGAVLLYVFLTALIFVAFPMNSATTSWQILLKERVLARNQTANDVVAFVSPRIPRLNVESDPAAWEAHATRLRSSILDNVIFRGRAARWRDAACRVEWMEPEPGGPGYHIRKLRYEALPGLWIPAVLYEPQQQSGAIPAVLNLNGHETLGKGANYTQIRCINLAKRGMRALNVEWFGMGQLSQSGFRHGRLNQLDLCGTSGLAPFYLAVKRALDLLLALPQADSERVAVTGLSGGGWQTIMISALDRRVTLANPVAGYSAFQTRLQHWPDLGDSEQTPLDLATLADYTHLTALVAPRPLLLTLNVKDRCYLPNQTLPPLLEAARPAYALYGQTDFLQSHINRFPGTHNYERDNREAFYQILAAHFSPDDSIWPVREIESDDELKTPEQLTVPLPENNADFNTLALAIFRELPPTETPPEDIMLREQWREHQRKSLRRLIAYQAASAEATQVSEASGPDWHARSWRLQIGTEWQVPAVEITPDAAERTTIIVADAGRASTVDTIKMLLRQKHRVVAIDAFNFGECQTPVHDYTFALMINTVGERPLGIQASQLVAAATWAGQQWQAPVGIQTFGPRSGCAALVASAIAPDTFAAIQLQDDFPSLSVLLTENMMFESAPELFCAGLIATHDLPQIRQLIPPGILH